MKSILLFFLLSAILPSQKWGIEDGWKGIKVFQTTRSDVERILGKPVNDGDDLKVNYENDDGLIHVIYSAGPCVDDPRGRGKYNIDKDTVIWYWVVFKKEIGISEINLRKDSYRRLEDPHVAGLFNYDNAVNGIRLETHMVHDNETVSSIYFDSTVNMRKGILCKSK